jgi:hypothetical protein
VLITRRPDTIPRYKSGKARAGTARRLVVFAHSNAASLTSCVIFRFDDSQSS